MFLSVCVSTIQFLNLKFPEYNGHQTILFLYYYVHYPVAVVVVVTVTMVGYVQFTVVFCKNDITFIVSLFFLIFLNTFEAITW